MTLDSQIEELASSFASITIDEEKIIKIQKCFRGWMVRVKQLPLIMYKIQKHLQKQSLTFSTQHEDGRINSCFDEDTIIDILIKQFDNRIFKPEIRKWYDILALDYTYGWIPINVKSTTTKTCDNTGNFAMCVYAYTDEVLELHKKKSYTNGNMSVILINKLEKKTYNRTSKKDYYFIIANKTDPSEIIVNSVKGLTTLTSNLHNPPFQVRWDENKTFKYKHIKKVIRDFIVCVQRPKPTWFETFMQKIRTIELP